MFRNTNAFSSFSMNDLRKARDFYGGLLQLETTETEGMLELHLPGAGRILLYPKSNHEPATFTVLNFTVPDAEKAVAALKQLGIVFESYDYPGLKTDEHNILRNEQMRMAQAWFKDPAGNILSVIETW